MDPSAGNPLVPCTKPAAIAAQRLNMGRWGRSTRFPLYAPEQARWVRNQLERGRTFAEIRGMLERGEFKPSSPVTES